MVLTLKCVAVVWAKGLNEMDAKPFIARYFPMSGVTTAKLLSGVTTAKLFAADRALRG